MQAPYGSWKSPITSEAIVASNIKLCEIRLDGDEIYWSEGRPTEGGRIVIVKWNNGNPIDITPPAPWNVRTRVHEYGGGAFQVADGVIYFTNFADQRMYCQKGASDPVAITPADSGFRYADAVHDKKRNRLICVREDHPLGKSDDQHEPANLIVSVNLDAALSAPDGGDILASGCDFYSTPRLSPDGNFLAYLSWNHPQMPWDGTSLWCMRLDDSGRAAAAPVLLAGGTSESVCQPEWSPDGEWLYFVSDRGEGGWWNLHRCKPDGSELVNILPRRGAEFGEPHWTFAGTTYGFEAAGALVCTYAEGGRQHLVRVDTATLRAAPLPLPHCAVAGIRVGPAAAAFIAGSAAAPRAVVRLDLRTLEYTTLRASSDAPIDQGYVSIAEPIEFPTTAAAADSDDSDAADAAADAAAAAAAAGAVTAHAYYYPPANRDYTAPAGELPPLLVRAHGGPTAAASPAYSPAIQYWTSRGFAVADVDYGGSTGHGRAYRQRLNGRWGLTDVADCVAAARHLAAAGRADPRRLCIDGASAGGFTALAALAARGAPFRAGASHYGVTDLERLAADTHKFESRYLDTLVGPRPAAADAYRRRSPIARAGRLRVPVIFFQGDEDMIVPRSQAEAMVEALRGGGGAGGVCAV